mgnify:CR=1 FL=1
MGFNLFICSINHPNLLFLYRIFIGIYPIAAWILGFVNPKAKQWHTGRKEILTQIAAALAANTKPIIWMHCASLGEFEQGRPVLEGLQKKYPNLTIIVDQSCWPLTALWSSTKLHTLGIVRSWYDIRGKLTKQLFYGAGELYKTKTTSHSIDLGPPR